MFLKTLGNSKKDEKPRLARVKKKRKPKHTRNKKQKLNQVITRRATKKGKG